MAPSALTHFIVESIKEIKEEQRLQRARIEELLKFKWQFVGAGLVASSLVTLVIQIGLKVL